MKVINVNDEIILLILIVKKNFILYCFAVNEFKEFVTFIFNNFDYSNNDLTLN